MLTYQLVYWAWMKLETDEVRAETDGAFFPPCPPSRSLPLARCPAAGGTRDVAENQTMADLRVCVLGAATLAGLEAQVDEYKRARDGAKTPAGGRAS